MSKNFCQNSPAQRNPAILSRHQRTVEADNNTLAAVLQCFANAWENASLLPYKCGACHPVCSTADTLAWLVLFDPYLSHTHIIVVVFRPVRALSRNEKPSSGMRIMRPNSNFLSHMYGTLCFQKCLLITGFPRTAKSWEYIDFNTRIQSSYS